jgi:hypothetical protein
MFTGSVYPERETNEHQPTILVLECLHIYHREPLNQQTGILSL